LLLEELKLSFIFPVFRFLQKRSDFVAFGIIFTVITLSSIPPLTSGGKLNIKDPDFFQYASRHESVRKSLYEHHTFPLRAYWFGGGFPTLGDPEDPSLNPLVLLSILFGAVMGLKLIGFLALLVGGLATYAFARYILGYTRWGALFAGLMFGTSLFVPIRIKGGNPNEVYAAFLPLCLLLIGLACRGRKIALLILPFVFYTMLSDGKLTCFMGMFYVGVLCLLDIVPYFSTFTSRNSSRKVDIRPLKIFFLALGITFLIGMIRILPALEHINAKGGLGNMDLFFYPETYSGSGYRFQQIWQETLGWKGQLGLLTIGWLPVILFGIALFAFWKKSLPWGISLVLFGWLLLASNAPIDVFKLLWNLPIFNAVRQPPKYFSFQLVFTFAAASGQFFWLLTKLRPRWLEHILAVLLVIGGVWFLYPKMAEIQRDTYDVDMPAEFLVPEKEFFNVQGLNLKRNRTEPFRSVAYLNLIRNVGTIDWYTGMPIDENAIPKYFIDGGNNYIPNPEYRGEAWMPDLSRASVAAESATEATSTAKVATIESLHSTLVTLRPNSITVQVDVKEPGVVVINQNYHRDWHTNKGKLFNKDGLLALPLQETGSHTIHLRYISRSFYTGLTISIFSLAVIVFICWAYVTGRMLDWSKHALPVLKIGSRVILWLID